MQVSLAPIVMVQKGGVDVPVSYTHLVASAICLPLRNKVTPPLVITRKVAAPESVGRKVER